MTLLALLALNTTDLSSCMVHSYFEEEPGSFSDFWPWVLFELPVACVQALQPVELVLIFALFQIAGSDRPFDLVQVLALHQEQMLTAA